MEGNDSVEYDRVHFVYQGDGTRKKTFEDDHLARSHTAKVNRSKSRRETNQRSVARPTPSQRKQLSLVQCQSSWKIRTTPRAATPAVVPRTLSPVLGAIPAVTFAPGVDRGGGDTITYYCRSVLKNNTSSDEIPWFIQAYCEHPVVFHALHYAVANHQDRLCGYVSKTNSAATIAHKLKALQLMNRAIDAYRSGSMKAGPLLVAITAVMRNEPDAGQLATDPMLLFRPHMPNVNNVALYGRGKAVQTANVHRSVISTLLKRPEHILAIEAPGLAKAIAGHNLIVVSRELVRPMYPNVWADGQLRAAILTTYGATSGRGFVNRCPGSLPLAAQDTFIYLSAVGTALGEHATHATSQDWLQSAASDAHHRVMSLIPWSELTQDEKSSCPQTIYECCRLVAIMYSSAVIFPMPTASGWHLKLLQQIRGLLEGASVYAWPEDGNWLLTWSLFIASITAVGTLESAFYETCLRQSLSALMITTWDAARQILNAFLWTDCACEAAGYSVWLRMIGGSGDGSTQTNQRATLESAEYVPRRRIPSVLTNGGSSDLVLGTG
ncbi:hypothetical protein LTR56_012378 [Elasticomyces elasticus]|nr:hypothetical protein LTR56_012378 [Elasticomyces elasticus]KAK3652338.1 hypothetical protein LTR22_011692 [Elasticomyces elasticus]KAK4918996.1 hypothetical protein LTR49_013313 [Elasticomyces elasticus]KAK5756653.1 hypothetical protein LTS12_013243 [Elasticomyces elasticus]